MRHDLADNFEFSISVSLRRLLLATNHLTVSMEVLLHILLMVLSSATFGKCCFTGMKTITNHRLLGHAYKNTSGITLSSCVFMCKSDTYCISINYDFISNRCELNERNVLMAPSQLWRWPVSFYVYCERLPSKNPCAFTSCQNGGRCEFVQESSSLWCRCKGGYIGRRCEECGNKTLGLQDGRIPDIRFSASSYKNTNLPNMARLRGPKSWMPKSEDPHKYLQIDLTPHRYIIVKIATQGDDTTADYVKEYKIAYTDYNGNWIVHGKKKFSSYHETIFEGTAYQGAIRLRTIDPSIKTMAIRILPQNASPMALRLELYGCRLAEK